MANKNIFDSNLVITKAVVDKGEIKTLEINGEDIPMTEPEVVVQDTKEVSVTENGSIDIEPDSGYDAIGKVELTVAVEAADIEANKEATIDVSTYTEPVEITPTAGKDGMAKATVTLTNIPEEGVTVTSKLYCFYSSSINKSCYTATLEDGPCEVIQYNTGLLETSAGAKSGNDVTINSQSGTSYSRRAANDIDLFDL